MIILTIRQKESLEKELSDTEEIISREVEAIGWCILEVWKINKS